eukprot:TRINITY_DN23178_c0_g1_i1.p1 TRINITY_DN23178_c0_g1~~TRINITY_DN23178_c0_g1_i1.p1  ORF type:complete len:284 (+),score=63.24 TRINITY_DN23178_c0_g1_i1:79-930(+)
MSRKDKNTKNRRRKERKNPELRKKLRKQWYQRRVREIIPMDHLTTSGKTRSYSSYAISKEMKEKLSKQDYEDVLVGIVRNTKFGNWMTSSGISIPYYLELPTNLMEKTLNRKIVSIMKDLLNKIVKPLFVEKDLPVLLVGPEVSGGILVSQLATSGDEELESWVEFVYMRKQKKGTGTRQQIEGIESVTNRNPDSPPISVIWIDDVMSTGKSLLDGISLLKSEYNMIARCAIFLVDRSSDRTLITDHNKMALASPEFRNFPIFAVYDLSEIAEKINERGRGEK